MSIWVLRGLRDGVVTTRWPAKPDDYADVWRGPARPLPATAGPPLEALCPTGAITAERGGNVHVDQGRCILCGRCVAERPDVFAWSRGATGPAAAAVTRDQLIVPELPETDDAVEAARTRLRERTAALRRSVHIRHVDAGSDGSEEWEIQALLGPVYDVHRLGIFFTASPRHADVLLVTGAGSDGMAAPLRATHDGMPDPKVVIAVGTYALLLAWNEYLYAFLLLSRETSLTLPVALGNFLSADDSPWELLMTAGFIYALPPAAIYYAFRKYMSSGLTAGAVKG